MGSDSIPAKGNVFGCFISARYLLALLGSFGMAIVYGLKVNLSITIVSMVNHTATQLQHGFVPDTENMKEYDHCLEAAFNNTNAMEDGPFDWPGTLQGTILSSYFWGYIVAQIPGGRISEMFSAKWVMFFAVTVNVVCTLLTPFAAKLHYAFMLIMRIGQGIGGGVTFPAMHVLLAHWAPPGERSVMSSIVYAGTALGTVISMISAGLIANAMGWEAVFYIMGVLSTVWLVLWGLLIADTPEKQTYIDEDERKFITASLGGNNKKSRNPPVPWKAVLTSLPFLAILVSHTCNNWGWYMILIELPLYMKSILKFSITQNASFTAMSFLFMWIFSLCISQLLDYLRRKKIIDTTCARKFATFISSFIPMLGFLVIGYLACMKIEFILLMVTMVASIGAMFSGFLSNHIDIAPNYAGTLMALTNTAATIPGIIVPIFVGKLTQADPSIHSWRIIFWTAVVFYLIEIIVYLLFASGDEQPWNKSHMNDPIESQPLKSPATPSCEIPGYSSTHTGTTKSESDTTLEAK